MRTRNIVCVFLAVLFFSACGEGKSAIAKSNLQRNIAPAIPASDSNTLLTDNNIFAFNLYRQVAADPGNLIFSPYSISLAVAMLYGGAGGQTASQVAEAFHFTLPPDRLHSAWNALSLDLAKRSQESKKIDSKAPMQLYVANAVWAQRGYPFEQDYLDLLAVNYGAGIRLVDFASETDAASRQINAWVSQQTQKKIKDIISPDSLKNDTRMVLANAIYFKAAWQDAFEVGSTQPGVFTLLDGTQIQVPMMQSQANIEIRSAVYDNYQVVELPYKGNLATLIIILPDADKFESVENALDADAFSAVLDALRVRYVDLYMPKFEFTADFDLVPVLSSLGMPAAFDRNKADFSSITKAERLYVDKALHKAYILVNETGTEAAAATIFGVRPASLPVELHIDRPFIFIIRDGPTGVVLFIGRVLNPLED
jgi:serpin B